MWMRCRGWSAWAGRGLLPGRRLGVAVWAARVRGASRASQRPLVRPDAKNASRTDDLVLPGALGLIHATVRALDRRHRGFILAEFRHAGREREIGRASCRERV